MESSDPPVETEMGTQSPEPAKEDDNSPPKETIKEKIAHLYRTYPPLVAEVVALILEGKEEELKVKHLTETNKGPMNSQAWDLVPRVCEQLTEDNYQAEPSVVSCAQAVLTYLSQIGSAKELLVALLEQADTHADDMKFKCLLVPVQTCLARLTSKRGHSLAIALETFSAHVESLPLPQDSNLEGEERKLLDLDEDVIRINDVIMSLLDFLKPFVEELSYKAMDGEKRQKEKKQIDELTKYLVSLMAHPLAYVDTSYEEPGDSERPVAKSTSRVCLEKLMHMLSLLQSDFHKCLVELKKESSRKSKAAAKGDGDSNLDMSKPIPELALACFSYFAFGEKLCPDNLPWMYTQSYMFELHCPFLISLVNHKESLIKWKGVQFFKCLLMCISEGSLSAYLLEWKQLTILVQAMLDVAIHCQLKEVRHISVKCLAHLLKRFEMKGRQQLLYNIIYSTKHSGVAGYAIGLLKEEVDEVLRSDTPSVYFTGAHLEKLLRVVFNLPNGATTDLLEQSERIMGALNLYRYLVLRDKPDVNITRVWSLIPLIEKKYCDTLRMSLKMSRSHYELEMSNTAKGDGAIAGMSFTVEGQDLPEVDKKQQMEALQMAMHTFDMIESVLVRVGELVEMQQKGTHAIH